MRNPFRCFNSSTEVIRLSSMMYIRYPLLLRQVEDLLFERGIDICHETVRLCWNRLGPMVRSEDPEQEIGRSTRLAAVAMATQTDIQTGAAILQATSTRICVVRKSLKNQLSR